MGGRIVAKFGHHRGHHLATHGPESVFLAISVVLAAWSSSAPQHVLRYAIIIVLSLATGIQNASIRKLAVPDLTTTVLTMTVTGMGADSALGGGRWLEIRQTGSRNRRHVRRSVAGSVTGPPCSDRRSPCDRPRHDHVRCVGKLWCREVRPTVDQGPKLRGTLRSEVVRRPSQEAAPGRASVDFGIVADVAQWEKVRTTTRGIGTRDLSSWGVEMTASGARAVLSTAMAARTSSMSRSVPMPVPLRMRLSLPSRLPRSIQVRQRSGSGALDDRFPASFPSGEGSDLAGIVVALAIGVDGFAVDDAVLGFSWRRSSHATHVSVPASQLIHKPAELSWEVAGSLYVVGCTAYAAVRAVDVKAGETVAVSAAAGGVGTVVVQLLALRDATTLGIASPSNADWLRSHGAIPVPYGDGLADRLKSAAPNGIDAFIDLFGPEYVQLAVDLGLPHDRIETIASFEKAQELGVKADGSVSASTAGGPRRNGGLVASGAIEIPIAATYPLERVAEAFEALERRHTRGKIVLIP